MGEEDYIWDVDYNQLAEQERARQRNIARSYMNSTPSVGNLYNAAMAFWNSLPIVGITGTDLAPINMGVAPSAGRVSPRSFRTLNVANPYRNYVANPAERAAALDYIDDLKKTGQYEQFLKNNPGYKINTTVEPGISEDWTYPYDVMVKHGLRQPIAPATKHPVPTQQRPIAPKKTAQQRSSEYYQEKIEDRNQGVYKRQRKAFNAQKALSDGDMRHVRSGRPSMAKVRLADLHIQNYSLSAQREYDKLRLKAAKKGYTTELMTNLPDIKDFLRNLIENEGHRW